MTSHKSLYEEDRATKRCEKHGLILHNGWCVSCAMDTTCEQTTFGCSCQRKEPAMNDHEVVREYLDNAEMLKDKGDNEFGHGFWIGRALSHAEQNAIEYEWLIHRMEERGLDTGLVAVPKIKAGRG